MSVNIVSQGLRRSGTTILFDILSEDTRFSSFYEPLCKGKKTIGGGSKAKQKDLTLLLRRARTEYCHTHNIDARNNLFNVGAPSNYKLEVLNKHINPEIVRYIKFLLEYNDNSLLKFTRATFLVEELHRLDPNAVFIHIVKHPIRWVASHICRSDYSRPIAKDPNIFFNKHAGYNFWSQESIANLFISKTDRSLLNKPGYYKLLYVWKHFNKIIEENGQRLYGNNYIKVENERLYHEYEDIVKSIYMKAGLETCDNTIYWAKNNLRKPKNIIFKGDRRWVKAFNELGINKRLS
tara:strand:- start:34690 stop:35568 length:879 start_codon:yes stop_codon:yes gene_type:complete